MKNKMIAWMAGVIAVVVALMVVIVVLEPEGEGITRAQAFKATALLTASKEQCQSYAAEAAGSHVSVKDQGNWFVKYMEDLYDEGYLTEELTPPTLAAAQGQLTYGEAAQIAEKVDRKLRTRVPVSKYSTFGPCPVPFSLNRSIASFTVCAENPNARFPFSLPAIHRKIISAGAPFRIASI